MISATAETISATAEMKKALRKPFLLQRKPSLRQQKHSPQRQKRIFRLQKGFPLHFLSAERANCSARGRNSTALFVCTSFSIKT